MIRRNILAVVLCCILFSLGAQAVRPMPSSEQPTTPDSLRATRLFVDGLKAMYLDDSMGVQRAEELFREVLTLDSTHAPSLYRLGYFALAKQELEEAEKFTRRAYEIDSTDFWYANGYGSVLMAMNKNSQALRIYEKLLKAESSNPSIYHTISSLYFRMGMPYSSIQVLDSAEMRAGFYGELHLRKCALLLETGQIDRARGEIVRYRNEAPYDIDAAMLLASIYEYQGQDSLEIQTLKEVLAVDPANSDALVALYEKYRDNGNITEFLATATEAIRNPQLSLETKKQIVGGIVNEESLCRRYFPQVSEMTNSMIAQYPDDYMSHHIYAMFLLNAGMAGNGLDKMKVFFEQHPDNEHSLDMVLALSMFVGESPDSLTAYTQRYIDARPGEVEPLLKQAIYTEDYKRSVELYKKALKMTNNDSIRSAIQCYIADTYNSNEIDKLAYKHYKKALALNPDNALALNNYAYDMMCKGLELDLCEEMAHRAITLAPNNIYYIDTYAWVLFLQGKLDEALKYIKIAVNMESNNTTVLVHYGDILYAKGEKFMARIYWRLALDKGHDPDEIAAKLKQP